MLALRWPVAVGVNCTPTKQELPAGGGAPRRVLGIIVKGLGFGVLLRKPSDQVRVAPLSRSLRLIEAYIAPVKAAPLNPLADI